MRSDCESPSKTDARCYLRQHEVSQRDSLETSLCAQQCKAVWSDNDTILFYTKSDNFTWTGLRLDYEEEYLEHFYKFDDRDGRLYWRNSLTAAGTRKGSSGKAWRGFDPNSQGAHWKFTVENLEMLDKDGEIYWPPKGGWPQIKRYRDELRGIAVSDIWDDVNKINPTGNERLGYPTQKPQALLERIISASSNPGDVVLDPFCGCGTTIHAAQKLDRQWIGIDVTYLAINLIKRRLRDAFGEEIEFEEKGQPTDLGGARQLAENDKFQFQHWALSLVHARPLKEGDGKGADRGVDGLLYFYETGDAQNPGSACTSRAGSGASPEPSSREAVARGRTTEHARRVRSSELKRESVHREKSIVQVKGGGTGAKDIRDLIGTVENQRAIGGILITLDKPTKPMRDEAATAGRYEAKLWQKDYPKIQIVTIAGLLDGTAVTQRESARPGFQTINAPPSVNPFAMAARETNEHKQTEISLGIFPPNRQ